MKILFGALLIYGCYCLLLFFMQRTIIFPRGMIGVPSGDTPNIAGMEKIWLTTSFGKVESWYFPPTNKARNSPSPAVIFGHGNGELIDFWPYELKRFNDLGLGLLLVEYPGYGRSPGKPTQKSIKETFISAYDTITQRKDVDASKIVLFGRSVGGGAVCTILSERPSAALILMSSFTSIRAFATRYLAPKFLILDPFDNLTAVQEYAGPVLILHGDRDEIIPYKHGKMLYRAAKDGKLITYSAGHNDFPPDWNRFWEDVEAFFRKAQIITQVSHA